MFVSSSLLNRQRDKTKHMKILFTLFASMLIWTSQAQNFYFDPSDTLDKIIVVSDVSDLNINIIRSGVTDTVWIDYELITNTLPEGWYAGYCDNHGCWGSLPENGSMSAMYGDQNSFIKLSINPQYLEGNGMVQYFVYEPGHYNDGQMMTYIIQTPGYVGIGEVENLEIRFYPNPFEDHIQVQSNVSLAAVNIYDITGKRVSESTVNQQTNIQIYSSRLQSGVYLLEVIDINGNKQTKRIIKK